MDAMNINVLGDDEQTLDGGKDRRYDGDSKLIVSFYMKPVHNPAKTAKEGRAIFDNVPYIKIAVPGDRLSAIDAPMDYEYEQRFGDRYQKWLSKQGEEEPGTPVSSMSWCSPAMAAELKTLNISTVEQLAEVDDARALRFTGMLQLRARAQAFLEASASASGVTQLQKSNEDLKAQNEDLQEQVRILAEQVKKLSKPAKGGTTQG